MHRILTGLIALALAGLVPFIAPSGATAAPAGVGADRASTAAPASAELRGKPHRKITEKIVKKGLRKLVFKGRVTGKPLYSHKVVKIERRIGKNGKWKVYKKVKSGAKGGIKAQVGAPRDGRWYFRAATPETKSYAASHSAGNYYTYTF